MKYHFHISHNAPDWGNDLVAKYYAIWLKVLDIDLNQDALWNMCKMPIKIISVFSHINAPALFLQPYCC